MRKSFVILNLMLVFMACRRDPPSTLKAAEDYWSDRGLPVKGDAWYQTVALSVRGKPFCSGVVINPSTILTAAHCFKNGRMGVYRGLEEVEILFGSYPDRSPLTQTLKPRLLEIHPQYNDLTYEHDLAKVYLTTPVSLARAQGAPLRIPQLVTQDQLEPLLGTNHPTVYLVGYGRNSYRAGEPHSKREVHGSIGGVKDSLALLIPTHEGYTCPGDSGCPAFVLGADQTPYLLGINHAGYDWGKGRQLGFEGAVSQVIPVAPYACWITAAAGQDQKALAQACPAPRPTNWDGMAPQSLRTQGPPRCAAVGSRAGGTQPSGGLKRVCTSTIRPVRSVVVPRAADFSIGCRSKISIR